MKERYIDLVPPELYGDAGDAQRMKDWCAALVEQVNFCLSVIYKSTKGGN